MEEYFNKLLNKDPIEDLDSREQTPLGHYLLYRIKVAKMKNTLAKTKKGKGMGQLAF